MKATSHISFTDSTIIPDKDIQINSDLDFVWRFCNVNLKKWKTPVEECYFNSRQLYSK